MRQQKGGSRRKLYFRLQQKFYTLRKILPHFDNQLNESTMKILATNTAYGKSSSPYCALEREEKGQN